MKKYITVLILLLFMLSGCSSKEENIANKKIETFHEPGKVTMNRMLWTEEFQLWEHDGIAHLASGACGDTLWYFGTRIGDDGLYVSGTDGEYVLELYDSVAEEYQVKEFTPAELNLDGELGYLLGMDMTDKESYMFRWAGYTKDSEGMYSQTSDIIVFSNLAGDNLHVDVRDCFAQEKIEAYSSEILPLWPYEECHATGENMIWLLQTSGGAPVFYLIDKDGKPVMQYDGDGMLMAGDPICTREGNVILPFYCYAEKKYEFKMADIASKKMKTLATMEAQPPFLSQVYGLFGKELYYKSQNPETGIGEGIVKWNIETGEQTWIYEFQIGGLSAYETMLAVTDESKLAMRLLKLTGNQARDWIVPLGEEVAAEAGDICIADLTGQGEALAMSTSKASMEIPYLEFTYEDESAEENRTRVLTELAKGEGPDILFVSEEDYATLAEKGLLSDINTLLDEEFRKELLPAVLEMAKVDDTLLGLPVGVRAETFVMDHQNQSEWSGFIYSPYVLKGYLSPQVTMQKIINYSQEDSFLIDWENGKSHFDDERFVNLLKLTAKDRSKENAENYAETDYVWGYFLYESNLLDFFSSWDANDIEGYLLPEGGLVVVNKNTVNKEAVSLYLEFLFGEEMQTETTKHCLSVRKLVPEDYLVTNDAGEPVFMGGTNANKVPVYEDGTTPLHTAAKFLENCQPAPRTHYQISQIAAEELTRMYAEGKDAREVSKIINNRVQLYLDEQK